MYPLNRFFQLTLLALVLGLASCGFQLRGSVQLSPALANTFVDGDEFSFLVRELRNLLETEGAVVPQRKEDAATVIKILKEDSQRRVLSVSGATAKASEFQLFQSVTFSLVDADGKTLVPAQSTSLTRDYVFDPEDVLGKTREEAELSRYMQRELAAAVLRKLSAVTR